MTSIALTVAAEFGQYSGAHPATWSNGTIFTPTLLQRCISRLRFFQTAIKPRNFSRPPPFSQSAF
jgi:hypothetical protein